MVRLRWGAAPIRSCPGRSEFCAVPAHFWSGSWWNFGKFAFKFSQERRCSCSKGRNRSFSPLALWIMPKGTLGKRFSIVLFWQIVNACFESWKRYNQTLGYIARLLNRRILRYRSYQRRQGIKRWDRLDIDLEFAFAQLES